MTTLWDQAHAKAKESQYWTDTSQMLEVTYNTLVNLGALFFLGVLNYFLGVVNDVWYLIDVNGKITKA